MGNSKKIGFWGRRGLCITLIFLLSGVVGVRTTRGEDTASSDVSGQERESRLEEIKKALEKAENQKKQKEEKSAPDADSSGLPSSESNDGDAVKEEEIPFSKAASVRRQEPRSGDAEQEQSGKGVASGEKEISGPVQGPERQAQVPAEEAVSKVSPEESRMEYVALENITWEISGKKVMLRLWTSGQSTPTVDMIRDEHGMKMRLRPKGLAARIRPAPSAVPPGVQSFSIQENPELAKAWGLEAPYYAVDEIQALFASPVQYSLHQEPGLLKITFLLPKKVEPKKIELPPPPVESMETMQREALASPETTLGTSYQSQMQLENRILYGAQKPPSIMDLYKRERDNAEFSSVSGLPENVRPVLDAEHPSFGTAEYFKKYIHGSIRQTFNFASNYNQGTTTAFQENDSDRGAPERGKNIGTILGTPAVALLFYRPGTFDVSTGYSASRDFPMTNNNFVYGLDRQNINLGIGHYSKKRYAFSVQNNLRLFGGMTRQKIDGKWIKTPWQTQQGYQLDNRAGLNYRLSKRWLWGAGAGTSRTRSETKTPGGRSRDVLGDLNTYLKFRVTSRLDMLLGTDYTHVFKDTSGNDSTDVTGPSTIITTKGKNLQSVFVSADYRYSKKFTLRGTFQGSLIDWDIGKVGGSVRATYQRTPYDDLSLQYSSSVIQNNTDKILSRSVSINSGRGILLQRYVTLGLKYNRQFDHGRTRGSLEVVYLKNSPLSGVFYGNTNTSTINYDVRFVASIRRAILRNRAWLGLLYSYEYAPNSIRNSATGEHDRTSNTAQTIIVTMEYQF